MNFIELQKILKDKLGIEHLADIARELETSPQAVSNWKARGKVPYKYVSKIRSKFNKIDSISSDIQNEVILTKNNEQKFYQNNKNFEEQAISLIDILLILVKHLKIIILVPLSICVITYFYVNLSYSPLYESTATIMSSSGGNQSQASGIASYFGVSMPNQSGPSWVYPEIIKSRTLARAVLKRKFDTETYGPDKSLLEILTYGNHNEKDKDFLTKKGIDKLLGMIEVESAGSNFLLKVVTFEAVFARDLALAIIEELDNHQAGYNKNKTSKGRQFTEERITNTESELKLAEEELKTFRERNRRFENSPSLMLEQQRLLREVSVLTGVFTTLKQQLETIKIEEVKDADYVLVMDPPEAPLYPKDSNKKQTLIFSGLFGILLSLIFIFLIEFILITNQNNDQSIKELKSLFFKNIPILNTLKRFTN